MSWINGILTFFLVVDCLLLILLVLIQLPKKEAGMGQAFGGGATDALFGAGSGTALTKVTKYVTVIFFLLTLTLSITNAHQNRNRVEDPRKHLKEGDKAPDIAPAASTAANQANTNVLKLTNALSLTNIPLLSSTSSPVATGSNVTSPSATNPVPLPPGDKK